MNERSTGPELGPTHRHPSDLAVRTWPQARELFGDDPIALIPVGATEPHGPHLPLDVDVTISLAQARRAAEKFEALGVSAFVLPPFNYGVTFFTEGFEGRVTLRPGTLWAMFDDVFKSLHEQGVHRILVCNSHFEPEQVRVLRGVTKDYAEPEFAKPDSERPHVLLVDPTRRSIAERLGDEFKSGECHAGRYESSIVMAADPEQVRDAERSALPALEVELVRKMQAGAKSFRDVGADDAYCGDPASATAAEGLDLIERLADVAVEAAQGAWPRRFEPSSSQ